MDFEALIILPNLKSASLNTQSPLMETLFFHSEECHNLKAEICKWLSLSIPPQKTSSTGTTAHFIFNPIYLCLLSFFFFFLYIFACPLLTLKKI